MKITTITTSDIKKLKDAAKLFKKDETRPYLSNFLIIKRGYNAEALATNGHVAIRLELNATLENVERFQLSFSALKMLNDKSNLEISQAGKDGLILSNGALVINAANVGQVPDITRVMNPFPCEEAEFSFCVDPQLFKHFTSTNFVTVKIKNNIAQIFDDKTEKKMGEMGVLMLALSKK
jgi:hypothetical protein